MAKKRIVVLGGVGFIGSHLCRTLVERGDEVFAIDVRDVAHAPMLRPALRLSNFHYIHHNIVHPFGIRCDEIYNLAAPTTVRYKKALPVETLRVGMLGSIHALDTARTEHARVVFSSSGCVGKMSELSNDAHQPTSTHRLLFESKRAAEALHRAYRQEFGVDTRIARIYNCYGIGCDLMDQRVVTKMVVAALQNRDLVIEGSGEQQRSFCYVGDIVEGLITLMQALPTDHTRMVNLGSGEAVSILDLAKRILQLTGSRSRILHVAARNDEFANLLPDLTATQRELGWRAETSLDEGLKRTINYIEKELTERSGTFLSWIEINQ